MSQIRNGDFYRSIKSQDGSENPPNQVENTSRLYPDLDADGDYVHFEMTPIKGDSLLWLTLRRGITPQRAAISLRKTADLIDRQEIGLLEVLEGREEPVRLTYNERRRRVALSPN